MDASCFFVILFISLYPQFLSLLKMCPCCCIRERHRDLVRPETIKVTRGGLHRHILCPAERELQSASCSSPHTWQLHHNTCSARLIPEKPRLRWRPTADPPSPPNTPSWVPPLIYYYWQTGITLHFTAANKPQTCVLSWVAQNSMATGTPPFTTHRFQWFIHMFSYF